MDRATIEARINAGLSIAASVLGGTWQVYRPTNALAPLETVLMSVQGAVSEDPGLKMTAPAVYGDALRYWVGDSSALQGGDILVNGGGTTLFVAAIPGVARTLLVLCNAALSFSQWETNTGYGGGVEQVVAQSWPASVLLSGHGPPNPAGLPGENRDSGWRITLPAVPGVVLGTGMQAVDGLGRRYLLNGVEVSGMGVRIEAVYAGS